jgi:hypothetical protein
MRWRERAFECVGLTWEEVSTRLAELLVLRAKSDDRFVALSSKDVHRFVQFAQDDAPQDQCGAKQSATTS